MTTTDDSRGATAGQKNRLWAWRTPERTIPTP